MLTNSDQLTGKHPVYEIIVGGHLNPSWETWFDSLTVTQNTDGTTTLLGPVADQAALFGLVKKAHYLNLELISLQKIDPLTTETEFRKDIP